MAWAARKVRIVIILGKDLGGERDERIICTLVHFLLTSLLVVFLGVYADRGDTRGRRPSGQDSFASHCNVPLCPLRRLRSE